MSDDKVNYAFGTHLRRLREKKSLTLKTLSERCGIALGYIASVERGEVNPTLQTITKFAEALECELFELFSFGIAGSDKKIIEKIDKSLTHIPSDQLFPLSLILKMLADPSGASQKKPAQKSRGASVPTKLLKPRQ